MQNVLIINFPNINFFINIKTSQVIDFQYLKLNIYFELVVVDITIKR